MLTPETESTSPNNANSNQSSPLSTPKASSGPSDNFSPPSRLDDLQSPTTEGVTEDGCDCPTRWNSTYLMLNTALMYVNVFDRLKQREHQYKCCPDEGEWKSAKLICEKLKIFYTITEMFSGTKYPTSNIYFPKICEIRLTLFDWLKDSSSRIREMAKKMLEKFEKYWDVIHGMMGVAAVLDPRYKMTLLEYYFPKIYLRDSLFQIERIRKLCYNLVSEYQYKLDGGGIDSNHPTHSHVTSIGGDDSLNDYDAYVNSRKRARTTNVKSELDHYLEEDVLPRSIDFDILMWWKVHGCKFPTLQSIARDFLAIPVSTVASESAFSTSGRLVSPHRSRLHPKTLEALMCAQNWLLAIEKKEGESSSTLGYATIYEDMDTDEKGSDETVVG